MKEVREKINEFMTIVKEGIGSKLACVLYQLPPTYSYSEERMNDIFQSVDHQPGNVIEFRHISWWNEKVYVQFRKNHLSFCSTSFPGLPDDDIVTSTVF